MAAMKSGRVKLGIQGFERFSVCVVGELGIGIVPYSPLGRGFFGGKGVVENVPTISSLKVHPRFQAENMDKNKNIYERIERLAKKHQVTPAQLALAWVLLQGEDVVPIPGK
ncbi:aldo-keto reductase 1 [Spatholobus suberectus]|nr:aldo-keto reductase 1 [Spatholobus suberectus]